jgi:hypothetical protein
MKLLLILLTGIALLYFGCSQDIPSAPGLNQSDQVTNTLAKKPAPNLMGTTNAPFNFPPLLDPDGSGLPIFWKGTIVFGDDTYGLYFISHGEPRDYSQASPFYEDFVIHEFGNVGNVYLRGWNAGVVTYANNVPDPVKFLANGKITYASETCEKLKEWNGRSVHLRGNVYWNPIPIPGVGLVPEYAEGIFRIN